MKPIESRVGSKGELFPPKEIREKLGLTPNAKILYRVSEGRLIIEPVARLEDLMSNQPMQIISQNELREERESISKHVEARR